MFFDWKNQVEKLQLTRDLNNRAIIYQGLRLPLQKLPKLLQSNNQNTSNFCLVPLTHVYHISSCKNTRKDDILSSKVLIESILYDKVSPDKIRQNNDGYKKSIE